MKIPSDQVVPWIETGGSCEIGEPETTERFIEAESPPALKSKKIN
jgi:hypothetical protein